MRQSVDEIMVLSTCLQVDRTLFASPTKKWSVSSEPFATIPPLIFISMKNVPLLFFKASLSDYAWDMYELALL